MKSNGKKYHLVYKDQFEDIPNKEMTGGWFSDDGNWWVGAHINQEECSWINFDINLLTQHMKDLNIIDCCLSHEKTYALVQSPLWSEFI